jgi:hypothetical protein
MRDDICFPQCKKLLTDPKKVTRDGKEGVEITWGGNSSMSADVMARYLVIRASRSPACSSFCGKGGTVKSQSHEVPNESSVFLNNPHV